jgi:trimethylamine---corrinoid protein Co-methyltransferase
MTAARRLKYFSEEQLEQIENTALRLLEEVGISLLHDAALERLRGLGCRVADGRVLIPRDVIQWTIEHVTRFDTIYSPDGLRSLQLSKGECHFHNGGGVPFIYDIDGGARRLGSLQDVVEATRLLDALPNVDVVIPVLGAQDVPPEIMTIASVDATLRNTRKPVGLAAAEKPEDVRYLVAMAAACCGGEKAFRARPTTAIMVSPVSPLTFTDQVTATIMAVADSGAAFQSLPAPSLGATGPITMPGALALQHAEVLASFVIAAATRPGTPVMYCSRINAIDLRSAVSIWGSPEVGMTASGATQLAHRLGLACDAYGFAATPARLDPQFAYERFANAFVPALAGCDLLSGVGVLENNLAVSMLAAVIDDEIIGIIKHVARGCEVDEDTLAFAVLKEVIPAHGAFLSEMHTVRHMRRGAIWMPGVSQRGGASQGAGETGVLANARARVRQLLASHIVEPLPDDTLGHLDAIMAEARRELLPTG